MPAPILTPYRKSVPAPYHESRDLPPYRGLFAVDAKDFTGLPAAQHGPVSTLIPELVDEALRRADLRKLSEDKRFAANTGDGLVFGFDPVHLPYVLWPLLGVLDNVLREYNQQSVGPRIRLRASVHVGPLPDTGKPGDGNGTARNDTHRLLDSRQVKAILAGASEEVTQLAAVISERVFEDVVLGAYTGLHPDRCIEVTASVEGKDFGQRAWLHVPSPCGNLIRAGLEPREDPAARSQLTAAEGEADGDGARYSGNSQQVGQGHAVMGNVGRDVSYTGGATTYQGTNQHWGHGDNVSGDKQTSYGREDDR